MLHAHSHPGGRRYNHLGAGVGFSIRPPCLCGAELRWPLVRDSSGHLQIAALPINGSRPYADGDADLVHQAVDDRGDAR